MLFYYKVVMVTIVIP